MLLHAQTKSQLKGIVASPSHAYLFHGPQDSGKKRAALAVTAELVKNQVSDIVQKNILIGEHRHILLVSPIDGKSIKLGQVKELLHDLSLKTFDDSLVRVVIIDQAHKLSTEAANALLKSLEEPPENTIFFLLATSLSLVLPTIASRCQALAFLPTDEIELRQQVEVILAGKSDLTEKIIELSDGKPALALRLVEEPDLLEKYEAVRVLARGFDEESLTTRFKIAQEVAAQGEVPVLLAALITKKRQDFLQSPSQPGALESLLRAERFASRNVNSRLVIEFLALEMVQG